MELTCMQELVETSNVENGPNDPGLVYHLVVRK